MVVEENHSSATILGAKDLPRINDLATSGVVLDNYFAITHPSLPNYLALTSGSTFGFHVDCGNCTVSGPNLFDQLQQAGITWRVYAQGIPKACSHVALHGAYARRHVPALLYDSIRAHSAACRNVVPYEQLAIDERNAQLPKFAVVVPDLLHDMHGVTERHDDPQTRANSDSFVGVLYNTLTRSPSWRQGSRLAITFDEGGGYSPPPHGCCLGDAAGGHVATIITGPGLAPGHDTASYDHYSLLRSIETCFGLTHLAGAAHPATHDIPALVGSS